MCFINVVLLNSIAELSLFIHIEFSMRARRYRLLSYYYSLPPSWLAKLFVCLSLLLRSCTFLGFITLAINRFTAIYCPLKYRKGKYVGTVEMKYLICAVLTFLPLIFELMRSILETYYNPVENNAPKLAKQLWTMSHELLLGVQFCTLVYAARLHRLILDHPIWKWKAAEVQSSQPESWTVKRHFQRIKLHKFGNR